jgi:shikimate kinase
MPPIVRNVILVGPMGAGKSTIGRALADELGVVFHDSDDLVEERSGASISWIFDVEGEEGFRERETAVIRDLANARGMVLATGGGAVLREENRRILSGLGTVVYLETTVKQQLARTRRDRKRPLLRSQDREVVLAELFLQRDPLYREIADVIVRTDGRSSRAVVLDILQSLGSASS